MTEIGRLLPRGVVEERERGSLVVIADHRRQVTRLRIEQSPWATTRVVLIVDGSDAEMYERLAVLGDIGVVVDVRRSTGPAQLRAFEQSFFHVGRRGVWVILRAGWLPGRREPAVVLARTLQDGGPNRGLARRWREHARSASSVRVTPRLVVIRQGTRHLLRLRDDQALDLLPLREPDLRVTEIATLEAGAVDTDGLMHEYGGSPEPHLSRVLPFPVHHVRRYEGPVHLPRSSLAYHGSTVLPESFRWHLTSQPSVSALVNVDEHFGRLRRRQPRETLPGAYFNFSYTNPGHFGHLMTEAVARLWAWDAAKAADPSLKILCRVHPHSDAGSIERRLETTLLPAFGISPDDIVWFDRPLTVTSLVGCTPMWHNAPPFYVHPAITQTWDRLRTGVIGTEPVSGDRRIFVTRRAGKRRCANAAAVERVFAAHGFTIVAPEELSLAEQVSTFAAAQVVAGFGGSGMFNLVYAQSVETVIVLDQWAYQARNEHLFAAIHGAELHCFWSRPNRDHPPGGFAYRAHQSPWAFDFDSNGRELRKLLEGFVE